MTLEQDLENLRKKLTGDKKKDIEILFSSLQRFDDRPYRDEIINKISDMLHDLLKGTDEKTASLLTTYIQRQASADYDKKLLAIKKDVDEGRYQEAVDASIPLEKDIIASMENGKATQCDDSLSFRFYFSAMEYDLSNRFFPGNNAMLPIDAVSLYTLRGQAYFFLKEDEKAIESIRYAFNFDPVSVDLCFLLADIEKERMNGLSYLSYIERAKDYLYREGDYLRYLKYMAEYYRVFEKDDKTADELMTLLKKGKTYKGITTITKSTWEKEHKKILKDLNEKKIELLISDNVLSTAFDCYKECINADDREGINYYKSLLLPLIDKKKLDALSKKA